MKQYIFAGAADGMRGGGGESLTNGKTTIREDSR